jgi:protease I
MATIAFVLADDFEDSEFKVPFDRLRQAGHEVTVIGTEAGREVKGKKGKESFTPHTTADKVDAGAFDALVIPGGYSPDHLRTDEAIVGLVRKINEADKPIAAVCHAGSLLIEADLVRGKTVTSWPSIRTDLENAGATWVDQEVVEDGNIITSRNPGDLDAFTKAILDRL